MNVMFLEKLPFNFSGRGKVIFATSLHKYNEKRWEMTYEDSM